MSRLKYTTSCVPHPDVTYAWHMTHIESYHVDDATMMSMMRMMIRMLTMHQTVSNGFRVSHAGSDHVDYTMMTAMVHPCVSYGFRMTCAESYQ